MNLLLLSSSRVGNSGYLESSFEMITQQLGPSVKTIAFIPYAGVTVSFDDYEKLASRAFSEMGYQLTSVHHADDPAKPIEQADAIAVGGGNTFSLLNRLYQKRLIEVIKEKVTAGMPYLGWSAGSNIAAPMITTTNDMPIVQPPSFEALSLLPFQINPHYIDGNPPGHNGETREQRLAEFIQLSPLQKVVALPEGSALSSNERKLVYKGMNEGFLFTAESGKQPIMPNSDLSYLLK